jgi:hypothetical protein
MYSGNYDYPPTYLYIYLHPCRVYQMPGHCEIAYARFLLANWNTPPPYSFGMSSPPKPSLRGMSFVRAEEEISRIANREGI